MKLILTEIEVAEALNISRSCLRGMVDRGEGPPRIRLGERRRGFPAKALQEWVEAQTERAEANAAHKRAEEGAAA